MTKKQLEKLKPFLETLNQEQLKVIWYIEAIKKGNPCITEKQKEEAAERLGLVGAAGIDTAGGVKQ